MKDDRGQITIEALLILGMFMLLLLTVSIPGNFRAERATRDVQVVSDARYATEQIAAAANSVVNTYERRNISVYIPGFSSQGKSSGYFDTHRATRICSTDGSNLVTTVLISRRDSDGSILQQDSYKFTVPLNGAGWTITSTTGDAILDDEGKWRNIQISWKDINATTADHMWNATFPIAVDCSTSVAALWAAGF